MKQLSLKAKITVWVSLLAVVISLFSAVAVMLFGYSITQRTMKRNLISAVETNINEIEIRSSKNELRLDDEFDVYIDYKKQFIEIDDDFTKEINDVSVSLYGDGSVLYGESLIDTEKYPFKEKGIRAAKQGKESYFIYDRRLKGDRKNKLWIRGVVSHKLALSQSVSVIDDYLVIIPVLVLITVAGALLLSRRALGPIEEISAAADEIRQGSDLSKRIETKSSSREITQLTSSFNGMLERIEGSFERERRFNSDISHELRTPVSVILSASELALEDTGEEQYIESLEIIQRQGKKMSSMIENMLEYSRLDTQKPEIERLNLSRLLDGICDEIRLTDRKGITLFREIEKDIEISANAELITRMITNLLSNAYKYGKEGGKVYVVLSRENDCAVLKIKDDGRGISEKDLPHIFDAFYCSDSSRSQGGIGLGLSFVKKIAALHGGEITVNSVENLGSEFIYRQKLS